MSLATWKAEFYAKPANVIPVDEAIDHSLRKWIGLRPENMAKHQVVKDGGRIKDDTDQIQMTGSTCALCRHFGLLAESVFCAACPLRLVLGSPCDVHDESPYNVWLDTGDPSQMIEALQKAVRDHDDRPVNNEAY